VTDANDTIINEEISDRTPDLKIAAKRFFHRSFHGRTVGRIEQKAVISQFLDAPFGKQKGLYIAGHPGTGKTAVVTELLQSRSPESHLMLNCILKGSVRLTVQSILDHFRVSSLDQLSQVCLVLDEIDFLAELDVSLIQSFYSNKSIKVIGIANALDLAINKLPNNSTPLSFPPYTVQDITAIITSRLEFANLELGTDIQLLDPLATELCARKVASTGDLRRALDVIQFAIDAAPERKQNGSLIDLPLLLKTLERIYPIQSASSQSKVTRILDQCNLHQKVILIALLQARRMLLEARPMLATVMQEYKKTIEYGKFGDALARPDFLDAIANLEALGLTRTSLSSGKNSSAGDKWTQQRVSIEVDPSELGSAISANNPLLACLLTIAVR
jgi:Cdc6-like AAA superfamily ATPase